MNDSMMSSTNYYMMSKSSCSSRNNTSFSSENDEESGWTSYLEGFMANDDDDDDISNYYESFSIISDAAYSPTPSIIDDDPNLHDRRDYLITRKRRSKATTHTVDLELEDTATSPSHNTPKVDDIDQLLFMNPNGLNGKDVSQEKGNTLEQAAVGKGNIEMGFMDTQLRRKGLCLVPMSMLLRYSS